MNEDDATKYVGHISHVGRTVNVATNTASVLDGLAAFYSPYYDMKPGGVDHPDATVMCQVRGGAAGPSDRVGDMRIYRTRPSLTSSAHGCRSFRRPEVQLEIAIDDGGCVTIAAPDALVVELQARVLLRDQLLQRFEHDAGAVIWHAAAVARRGRGVAILGERNAGKTTAMLALMARSGHDFVSADRVGIMATPPAPPVLLGVPARANVHLVSLRPGEPLADLRVGVDAATAIDGKVLVDPAELAAHFGVGITASAQLDTVIVPRIDEAARSQVARTQDPRHVRALLAGHVLGEANAANTHPHWLRHPAVSVETAGRSDDAVERVLADIAERCTVYEFTGDRSSYLDWLAAVFH